MDANEREIAYDFESLRIKLIESYSRILEMEARYRRYIWMLTISAGGEIRIPESVMRDVRDSGELSTMEDPVSGDLVFRASLLGDGVVGT